MDEEAKEQEDLGVVEKRVYSRAVAGGAIDATVRRTGRRGLRQDPINRDELIATARAGDREDLLELIEPFKVRYTDGDTAVLTWTETNEKERVPVPSDAEAGSAEYRERGVKAVTAPDRLRH